MPLKLNVGLTKKLGLPNYGSSGASCHLELELDQSLITGDPAGFQDRIRRTFAVCRQAVEEELAGHQSYGDESDPADSARSAAAQSNRSGRNGVRRNGRPQRASQKQFDYAQQLARQVRELGVRRLETLAVKMYGKPLAELSSLDASGLIDVLKNIKDGKIELADALAESAVEREAAA